MRCSIASGDDNNDDNDGDDSCDNDDDGDDGENYVDVVKNDVLSVVDD